MMWRRLAAVGVGLLAFVLCLALQFPTDVVVRRALARGTPAGWPAVVFEQAALLPSGVRLDGVTLRDSTGAALLTGGDFHLRPSLSGLVRDGSGLPWQIDAAVCGGQSEATVSGERPATALSLSWRDVDLASCPPLGIAAGALAGLARGTARFAFHPASPPEGVGIVELSGASWQGQGLLGGLGVLHAEAASIRWRLANGQLSLESLELRGPEVTASGRGQLRVAAPFTASNIDLTLELTPAPGAPERVRFLLGRAPTAAGTPPVPIQLTVGGTLATPSIVVQ